MYVFINSYMFDLCVSLGKAMKRFTGTVSEHFENKQNEDRERKRLRLSGGHGEEICFNSEGGGSGLGDTSNADGGQIFCNDGDTHLSSTVPSDSISISVPSGTNHVCSEYKSIASSMDDSFQEVSETEDGTSPRSSILAHVHNDLIVAQNESAPEDHIPVSPIPTNIPNLEDHGNNCSPDAMLFVDLENDNCTEQHPVSCVNDLPRIACRCDAENLTTSLLHVMILEGHSDDVLCVVVDENMIISASADTTAKVWDASEQNQLCSFRGHTAAVTSVVLLSVEETSILSHEMKLQNISKVVITGSLDCTCRLWSLPDGHEISSFYTYNGINCVKYLENEMCVVIGTDGGKLEVWDLCSSTLIHSIFAHEDLISDICVDLPYVHSVSVDGMIKVWLLEEKFLQPLYSRKRKELSGDHINFSPCHWKAISSHQNMLYLGDKSSHLKVLDWRSGKLKILQNGRFRIGEVNALCIHNEILLSSSFDSETSKGFIHVWLLPEMKYLCTLLGDVERIVSLAMTKTKEGILQIVSAGSQLMIWEFDFSQPPLDKNETSFYCIALEQLNADASIDPNIEFSSQRDKDNSPYVSDKSKSWRCIVI